MTIDEFLATGKPSENVRIVSAALLTVVSLAGGIVNTLVFVSLLLQVSKKDGFLKICCVKSFGNDIVCVGYLFWPIPVTFLNDYFLPHMFNAFMGQLVGWFGWSISPLTQVLLTTNRVFAVFFPHLYQRNYKFAPSTVGLAICLCLAFLLFVAFFPEGCHYLYNLDDIGWLPEESVCTSIRRQIFIVSMIIIVIVTSVCCILIFTKLVADTNAVLLSSSQSSSRRGKHQKILFQTLVQNFLILADTLNTTVTYKVFPVLFFQFLTLSFSMVFLRALEGLVMLTMNDRISKGVRSLMRMKNAELPSIRGHSMIFNVSKCETLNPLKMILGGTIYLPADSRAPFPIPSNFTCTYEFFVPKDTYLRLSVINSLLDKDYIEFADSVGYVKMLTVSNVHNEELFATFGHGYAKIVTGAEGNSKALLVFEWQKMDSSVGNVTLSKNNSGTNVDCSVLQQKPITFVAAEGEKVALNVAHSGYILDNFDSFFIFDGPNTDSPVVGRMSTHVVVPFVPKNQSVTVIGLTRQVVYSNIIANIQSNIIKYRKYQAAVVIDQYGGSLDSINQTIAMTFIAKDENQKGNQQLYITTLAFKEVENELCDMRIISGTPSPISKYLLSYNPSSPLHISFPQQFPSSLFSIELTDCSVYMVLSKNVPENFYLTDSERLGYVFTPSFLNEDLSPTLNFTLSSNETLHFSTTVESVSVVGDDQLAINVFNSKGISAMSVIVTGNQTGGSAEAMGTSVNIDFNGTTGQGQAKIRYHISKISGDLPTLYVVLSLWARLM